MSEQMAMQHSHSACQVLTKGGAKAKFSAYLYPSKSCLAPQQRCVQSALQSSHNPGSNGPSQNSPPIEAQTADEEGQ